MWVPLSFGNPEIEKNHPRHFWPGAAYVDWVGTTWYSQYRSSSAFHSFYSNRLWHSKPFAFAEWGIWGADAPSFVGQFFGFLKSHPRVRMAVYYQSASLKPEFALSNHPASRAALRRAVKWPRLTGVAP
jgi:beta-mannanase